MVSHGAFAPDSAPDPPQKAAVDMTLGHGADSFLSQPGDPEDPWARESFVTLVDVAVNHEEFFYPLPTKEIGMPLSLAIDALQKARVVRAFDSEVAEDLNPDRKVFENHYASFAKFARKSPDELRDWLDFQAPNAAAYQRDSDYIDSWIQELWTAEPKVESLARHVRVPPNRLRDAFNVTFRAKQYDAILDSDDVYYFPHRLRVLADQYQKAPIPWNPVDVPWSWGRYLAVAIERGWVKGDPNQIMEIVASLRSKVGLKDATWYRLGSKSEKEREDILTALAADSGFPAELKEVVGKHIAFLLRASPLVLTAAELASVWLGGPHLHAHDVAVTTSLQTGALAASVWKPTVPVPGKVAKLRRGAVKWPGLLNDSP